MQIPRRDLLKLALLSPLALSCLRNKSELVVEQTESLYFGYGGTDKEEGPKGLGIYDFKKVQQIDLGYEVHSAAASTSAKLKVFLPKLGAMAYYQRDNGPLKPILPSPGKYFYGHGAFDEERKVFYSTQSTVENQDSPKQLYDVGEIHIHSLENLDIIGGFPSFGNNPHDLFIQGDDLIVCNGGAKTSVAYIDLKTKKLRTSFGLPKSPHLGFGHVTPVDSETVAVGTVSRESGKPCEGYLVHRERGLTKLEIPDPLLQFFTGQLLSLCHFDGYVYATCPATGYVFVWDLKGKFVSAVTARNASSLVFSPHHNGVLVGSGNFDDPLRLLKASGNIVTSKVIPGPGARIGAHALLISG